MTRSALRIRTVQHLALRLGVDERWLRRLAAGISDHVQPKDRPKKAGGTRRVYMPSEDLKRVQQLVCRVLLQPLLLPDSLHGSVPGKSARTNAELHTGRPVVASLDIKDFYPSIRYDRVYSLFADLECSPDVARLLTRLTTYDRHLAQGFPSSSAIANLILAGIAPRLDRLAEDHGLTVTLYQDDLTISGGHRIQDLLSLFSRILRQCGFEINLSKMKVMYSHERQEVTGYVVNKTVNVPREEYRRLRTLLHRCEVEGIEQVADRPLDEFRNHLRGRIQRVLEVRPERGQKLLDVLQRL